MKKSSIYYLFISLRPNVWPRISAEMLLGASLVPHALSKIPEFLLGFLILGPFMSGFSYLLNDISDKKFDRSHPLRKKRPVASGALSTRIAFLTAVVFIFLGLVLSFFISLPFFISCLVLFGSQILYTISLFRLKEVAFADILLNGINAFARFFGAYGIVGGTLSHFPIFFALFAITIKVLLFLGHRWQSRNQEIVLGYKSSVVFLNKTSMRLLVSFLFLIAIFLYTFSLFLYNIPKIAFLYPLFSLLLFLPFIGSFAHGLLFGTEKNEYFRNYLYGVLLLFSFFFFITVQISLASQ